MLPPIDQDYLAARFPGHEVVPDAGLIAVVLPGLVLPPGFTLQTPRHVVVQSGDRADRWRWYRCNSSNRSLFGP